MEITKDELFNIKYNSKKNIIEIIDKKNNLRMFIRKNRFILSIVGTTTLLVTINIVLIEKFYSLLLAL